MKLKSIFSKEIMESSITEGVAYEKQKTDAITFDIEKRINFSNAFLLHAFFTVIIALCSLPTMMIHLYLAIPGLIFAGIYLIATFSHLTKMSGQIDNPYLQGDIQE